MAKPESRSWDSNRGQLTDLAPGWQLDFAVAILPVNR